MNRWIACLLAIGMVAVTGCAAMKSANVQNAMPIIPAPEKWEYIKGTPFVLDANTKIAVPLTDSTETAEFLQAAIQDRTGFKAEIVGWDHMDPNRFSYIQVVKVRRVKKPGNPTRNPEGYMLAVTPRSVVLFGQEDGLFYAVQSLLQLIDAQSPNKGKAVSLDCMRINDRPRFGYRGVMLDESRHFFGKAAVKQMLDMMAYLKLNRLHWHLTDSQGWRVEIKKYPKLTEIGGQGRGIDPNAPSFYTQEDIKELVEYARVRRIEIIPEVDMPGHATAATKSYPEISGGDDSKRPGFTFNPAKELTYQFLADVMEELSQLFPFGILNIGGDEVFFGNESWKTDPQILKFTRDQGLKNEVELEHYFIRRMSKVVNDLNMTVMGWDDIGAAGIDPAKSILLWWHHEKPEVLTNSLKQGFPVVMCPRDPLYFDFIQHSTHKIGRKEYGGKKVTNDLANVYDFPDRYIDKLAPKGTESKILGMEACVWTESIASLKRLQFILYPRMAALAEDAWTPVKNKNFKNFESRVKGFLKTLDKKGIYYFNPFDPASTPEPAGPPRTKPAVG